MSDTPTRWRPASWVALALVVLVLLAARRHRPDDAPYVPHDDGELLELLPARLDPAADALRALEARLARAPEDIGLACEVAEAHLAAAVKSGDPSHLAYADAALAPFSGKQNEHVTRLREQIERQRRELTKTAP
jgi:hypothetical protein